MSLITLIDGVLLLAMIGVSLYGVTALPPGARMPMHFGTGGYNRWVSRNVGLTMWPAGGVVIYVILIVTSRDHGTHSGSGPVVGLTVALGVILVTEIGAVAVALSRGRRG